MNTDPINPATDLAAAYEQRWATERAIFSELGTNQREIDDLYYMGVVEAIESWQRGYRCYEDAVELATKRAQDGLKARERRLSGFATRRSGEA